LTLTTARLLSPHLSAENHDTLLAAAAGKSKREVALLLAGMFPLPDVPTSIRKVPTPRATPTGLADRGAAPGGGQAVESVDAPVPGLFHGPSASDVPACGPPSAPGSIGPLPRPQPLSHAKARERVRPLAADRYEIRFTARAATREKLQLASDLLRHTVPDGDVAEIIDRALTVLLEDLAKKRFAATVRPASETRQVRGVTTRTRHVPAKVKRGVWLRDGGRCAFVSKGSRRCREGGFLEFHHVRPYAAGGEATVENIELRCRAHNGYEAELFYGRRFVAATERGVEQDVRFSDTSGGSELGPDQVAAQRSMARPEAGRPMLPEP
jgi:hypothetical protein